MGPGIALECEAHKHKHGVFSLFYYFHHGGGFPLLFRVTASFSVCHTPLVLSPLIEELDIMPFRKLDAVVVDCCHGGDGLVFAPLFFFSCFYFLGTVAFGQDGFTHVFY